MNMASEEPTTVSAIPQIDQAIKHHSASDIKQVVTKVHLFDRFLRLQIK